MDGGGKKWVGEQGGRQKPDSSRARERGAREARERGDIDEGRQVMIYRGKFPAENYTQTRPADLPLKGNRLSFFLARRVARVKATRVAIRFAHEEIVICTPHGASFLSKSAIYVYSVTVFPSRSCFECLLPAKCVQLIINDR